MFGKSLFIMPIHFLPKESVDFFRNDARTGSIFFTIPRCTKAGTLWYNDFFDHPVPDFMSTPKSTTDVKGSWDVENSPRRFATAPLRLMLSRMRTLSDMGMCVNAWAVKAGLMQQHNRTVPRPGVFLSSHQGGSQH